MIKLLREYFVHPTPAQTRQRQIEKAERELVDLEAEIEYATAMRDMYKARLARLTTH